MFRRTDLGIVNEHAFYDVQYILYCEGSPSDHGESSSFDEVFWTKVLRLAGVSAHCKSAGSKSVLLSFAREMIDNDVQNVLIAMDRDYDFLRGRRIQDRRVIYTFGYSWESDVLDTFDFDLALSLFCNTTHTKKAREEFEYFLDKNRLLFRRLFALDYKYIGNSVALFDRKKPQSVIDAASGTEPRIRMTTLLESAQKMGRYQTGSLPRNVYSSASGFREFHGKVVAKFKYYWFHYRSRRVSGARKIPFDAFISALISSMDISDSAVKRNDYYLDVTSSL